MSSSQGWLDVLKRFPCANPEAHVLDPAYDDDLQFYEGNGWLCDGCAQEKGLKW